MKRTIALFTLLLFGLGFAQAQDVYFAGNQDGIGKVFKNNILQYSIADTSAVNIAEMKAANDSTLYCVGHTLSDQRGHIWQNDTVLFTTDANNNLSRLILDANGWTASGGNKVWQNGEVLYDYFIDSLTSCNVYALAIDTLTGDIYAGGSIVTPAVYATVWSDDEVLWQLDGWSQVVDLCHDGEHLFVAGFVYGEDSIAGVVWQNDSIIFQSEETSINAITAYDSNVYWIGCTGDTAYVWQNGEVLYSHYGCTSINALCVNEYGVYYSTVTDDVVSIWKDDELLYQTEDCESIVSINVLPSTPEPPVPTATITVSVSDTLMGTVMGSGIYPIGDTIAIEAIPNIGYEFLHWNDSITDNPRNVVVTQDSTFVAQFSRIQYLIETQVLPEGTGIVTGGGTYYYGDTIQLEAIPHLGFEFLTWSDGNTDNPRIIIVEESLTFTANFGVKQCVVNTFASPIEGGIVLGGGTYSYGDTILLVAQNNTGYVFKMWEDEVLDNPRQIIVVDDVTYTAVFDPLQYEITTGCQPEDGGSVEGAGIYDYGTYATLTARPFNEYSFICWNDGITSNPRRIFVTQNAHYEALFVFNGVPTYYLKVLSNDPELGTVTGEGMYPEGTSVEISATPAMNARFIGWDDGNDENPRTVIVTSDMIITAIFESIPTYTIKVTSAAPEMGTVYGSGTYPVNTIINIGAVPAEGYHFVGWQDGDMNNPRSITVTEDAEYMANFSQVQPTTFTITVYFDESQGFILGAGTYNAGATASLAAIPADGYMFVKWSDGTTDNPKEVIVDHDIELAAFFNGTGIDESELEAINLYPNPANDKIHIEGLEGEHEISLFNATGMKVTSKMIYDNGEIDICGLPAGLYLIRLDGKFTIRFVKD